MYYYIGPNNQQLGPVPPEQLLSQGVTGETMVWKAGMTQWQKAKDVPELSQYFGNSFGAGNPYNNQSTQFNQPPPNYGGGYGNYGPQNAGQFGGAQQNPQPNYFANNNTSGKSRTTAGILAILIGGLGVHYFYLGKALPGIVYLLLCCTGIPAILGLIQGIIMLTMTDEQFYNKYVNTTSSFPF